MANQLELGIVTKEEMTQSEWQSYLHELAHMSKMDKNLHLIAMEWAEDNNDIEIV
jgi:hypothetical protein